MKSTRVLTVLAAVLLSLTTVGIGAAAATTTEDCQAILVALRSETLEAGTFTNAKDVNSLVAKVDAASAKLAQGKNGDAVQKLVDFQTTLTALATAAKPKVDLDVARSLSAEAQHAIDCITAIGT